jgi:hypothetical protein
MTIPQYDVNPLMMPMNFKDGGMASNVQKVQSQGRLNDSMLVHMSPREVAGLQALARQRGTSLTINPKTGLPEAFSLESLLPTIAGAALTPVLGPMAPLVVGGLGALATGSLEQGIMMGLGAMGGANIAGSAANLAAPAAAAAAAPTAAVAAPAAVGGAAGTTGLMASAAPATTLAQATQLAPAASVGGLDLIAPPLPEITSATTAATGSSLVPQAASEGVKAAATPAFIPDVGTATQATAPFATPETMANMVAPPMSYGERVMEGFGKVFESPSSLMSFAKDNAMDIASALVPSLTPEEEEEDKRRKAMIRPYEYQVDNLSGSPIDLAGTETERFRGRFVEKDPYLAAKGGLMSLAEGGEASSGSAPSGTTMYATPAEARVYSQIAAVQRAAGIPSLDLGNIEIIEAQRLSPYNPKPIPSTVERDYGIYRPEEEDSPSYREVQENKDEEEFKRGGGVKGVRKPISRDDPFYKFGTEMYKIAQEQFADGGMTGYSYDPTTNSYKMMAGGGLNSLKAGGLREGAFIVPADVISHLGNGSSEAGMKIIQERLKGRPIKGPGDGMSDSIPTTIAGKQPARVANEEAEIPPEVVAALGGGSLEKGAKKLYEMMDKIRQDRTGKKKQAPAVKADKYMPA